MTDRELIERAGCTAGYILRWCDTWMGGVGCVQRRVLDGDDEDLSQWLKFDPLNDNGDCALLEADANVDVRWYARGVQACLSRGRFNDPCWQRFDQHGGDKNKARRYASTRAAAAMAGEKGQG